ncbi:predicted protein [Nematostella vectensis]|uniref:Uncharacterized protein n=2 Tax=Nematostella vectensis TaxID=45351 RepID=A7SRW9_NEMVE|nr:predicted protein [Nematostella vectensis]|eukprot:XP_001625637.1 predicted protein [Nematostella vectensis]
MKIFLSLVVVCAFVNSVFAADCCSLQFSKSQKAFLRRMLQEEAKQLQKGMMQGMGKPQGKWVPLSANPVCFSATGRQFGAFNAPMEGFIAAIKLSYVSGHITCDTQESQTYNSKWGCAVTHPSRANDGRDLNTVVTKSNNKIVFPCPHDFEEGGSPSPAKWYKLDGFDSQSQALVFSRFDKPVFVAAREELRLWSGEDLTNIDSVNNSGQTCAMVFGWFM